jgi:hypothetical protein
LQPVQESMAATLEQKRQETQALASTVGEDVGKYLESVHAQVIAPADREALLRPVAATVRSLDTITTIDSLIARQSDLERLRTEIPAQADQLANQRVSDPENPTERTKPIVAVRVAAVADQVVLETAADVQGYVNKLRDRLMAEIDSNNRVRVE